MLQQNIKNKKLLYKLVLVASAVSFLAACGKKNSSAKNNDAVLFDDSSRGSSYSESLELIHLVTQFLGNEIVQSPVLLTAKIDGESLECEAIIDQSKPGIVILQEGCGIESHFESLNILFNKAHKLDKKLSKYSIDPNSSLCSGNAEWTEKSLDQAMLAFIPAAVKDELTVGAKISLNEKMGVAFFKRNDHSVYLFPWSQSCDNKPALTMHGGVWAELAALEPYSKEFFVDSKEIFFRKHLITQLEVKNNDITDPFVVEPFEQEEAVKQGMLGLINHELSNVSVGKLLLTPVMKIDPQTDEAVCITYKITPTFMNNKSDIVFDIINYSLSPIADNAGKKLFFVKDWSARYNSFSLPESHRSVYTKVFALGNFSDQFDVDTQISFAPTQSSFSKNDKAFDCAAEGGSCSFLKEPISNLASCAPFEIQ